MFNYSKKEIDDLAKLNGFRCETLEKVLRLIDVLNFINSKEELAGFLLLKGGTAINFTVFNLPRLSVDIDLDFSFSGSKEEILKKRNEITLSLKTYMQINEYVCTEDSRNYYALDSFVFSYFNKYGNKDHLKVEINYMNRYHIYEPNISDVNISLLDSFQIYTLNRYELFGSKIKALLERCTIRDVYDVYHMLCEEIFCDQEYRYIKKCVIFYMMVGKVDDRSFNELFEDFNIKIDDFLLDKIPQYLSSTLRLTDRFDMKKAVNGVKVFVNELLRLSENEYIFIEEFEKGNYIPEILFKDNNILERIRNHPMALWKISSKKSNSDSK